MIQRMLKQNMYYLITMILLIILFIILKNSVWYKPILDFDNKVFDFFKRIQTNELTIFFKIVTDLLAVIIPLVLFAFIILKKDKVYFYICAFTATFALFFSYLSKIIIHRERPLVALIKMPTTYSFPSGHTLFTFTFYVIVGYLFTINESIKVRKWLIMGCLFIAVITGISRIYLGVHYFSDVVGGIIFSIPLIIMIINIVEKNFKEIL